MSGFGKASYGSGRKNYFKVKNDGKEVVVRILPPFGSLSEKGRWAAFYAVHFGYKDTKGKLRPFQSCEEKNHKTKMIEVVDPATQRIQNLRAKQEEAKKSNNEVLAAQIGELLRRYNLNKKWYLNAVDLQGNIGIISIPHKQKMVLEEEIKKLQQQGVDPLSFDNGRFFAFSKSGSGITTVHSVRVYQESVEVPGHGTFMKDRVSVIDKAGQDRLANEATDLGDLYPTPTPEEILRMVQGNEADVEAVMSRYSNSSSAGGSEEEDYEDEAPAPAPTQRAVATPAPSLTPAAAPAVSAPISQPAAQPAAATQAPAATLGGQDISKLTNEEFLKMLNA